LSSPITELISGSGIASRVYVYRLVAHGEKQYSDRKGDHINSLEGLRDFLKRKLASKGGITNQKLPRYLAEYVWRYNHRNESDRIKMRRILIVLEKS